MATPEAPPQAGGGGGGGGRQRSQEIRSPRKTTDTTWGGGGGGGGACSGPASYIHTYICMFFRPVTGCTWHLKQQPPDAFRRNGFAVSTLVEGSWVLSGKSSCKATRKLAVPKYNLNEGGSNPLRAATRLTRLPSRYHN